MQKPVGLHFPKESNCSFSVPLGSWQGRTVAGGAYRIHDRCPFSGNPSSVSKRRVKIYLSTDDSGAIPVGLLQPIIERGGQVLVAFDGDRSGEAMAWRVDQQLPGVKRLAPAYGKDWNERLLHNEHPKRATQPERDQQRL